MTHRLNMKTFRILLLFACIGMLPLIAGAQKIAVKPQWEEPVRLVRGNEPAVMAPSFSKAQYPELPDHILPSLSRQIPLPKGSVSATATLDSLIYIPFTASEKLTLTGTELPAEPEVHVSVMYQRGNPVAVITVKPFGTDPATGLPAKLESFNLLVKSAAKDADHNPMFIHNYAKHSRLVVGDWYKLLVSETGVHKLTFADLKNMGMQVDGINPDHIAMFGKGGAMLSETAGQRYRDDLTEISIRVVTNTPGVFAEGDYILFYGEGPRTWTLNPFSNRINHATHLYTDQIAYFITVAKHPGLRIPVADPVTTASNYNTDSYTALALYEEDNINLLKSGRKWFSFKFDAYTRTLNIPEFNFPDIDLTTPVVLGFGLAGSAKQSMSFYIKANGVTVNTSNLPGGTGDNDFAFELASSQSFLATSDNLKIQVQFNPPGNSANGWLDYITLNVRSKLVFHGGQMDFRDPLSVSNGRVTAFSLQSEAKNIEVWDVTDHSYVHGIPINRSGNTVTFKQNTTELREMVAFDGTQFLSPVTAGKVENQDLHATGNYDMIIITDPVFRQQAERLAKLHHQQDDITAKVISLPEVYNEFSSGHQDITAIRDFMKMLYDRGYEQGAPRYLLLFGNASYDVKNRIPNNSNFVPTYESANSVKPTDSYLTDDFYGLLDDGEGTIANQVNGLLDIGIGRFPVRTLEQAANVVNKVEAYLLNDSLTQGDWRNTILVIADDENFNAHLDQAERLSDSIALHYPLFNVYKIYFDAFRQTSTPGGGRYPEVNREIVSHVDKGALITNYIGHGGLVGWADERVLEIADINAWKNFNRMGLFFTATCEFSRFDNPQQISAGELVFLNPDGGALSMITTTRLAYSATNESLNLSFIDTVLNQQGGIPRLGDIIKYTKNENPPGPNVRHLSLFGDPSLALSHPRYNVVTTSIVDPATLMAIDTLSANQQVTVNGEVQNHQNETINGFNGLLYVKVYDKLSTVRTLGQDPESLETDFSIQKNIIYQGKVKVANGMFSFSFPVPLDIDYNFGNGKISYYATDGVDDAHGYTDNFIIGGSKELPVADVTGPDIKLYINDTTFTDGDLTSENPILLVNLFDISGINTVGNGVGHDLTAMLDGDSYNSVLLNDFYVADCDSYRSGWAKYQFTGLDDGVHSITVKAWDVYNNSSEATITFTVKHDIRLNIDEVVAYPNPSKGPVCFRFRHNLFDGALNIEIEIYNTTGTLVRVLNPGKVISKGYVVDDVYWDGMGNHNSVLRNGLYICRVKVLDRNGNSSAQTVKIIMAK